MKNKYYMFDNTSVQKFVFDQSHTIPVGGFSLSPTCSVLGNKTPAQDTTTTTCAVINSAEKQFIEAVSSVVAINAKLIDWSHLSRMRLTDAEIDAFKNHLVWSSVSRHITLKTARKFRDHVDWAVFNRRMELHVMAQMRSKLSDAESGKKQSCVIDLNEYTA